MTSTQLLKKLFQEIDFESAKELVNTRRLFYQGRNITDDEIRTLLDIFRHNGKNTYGDFNKYLGNMEVLLKQKKDGVLEVHLG